jgi:hypothetical protein
MTDVTLSQGSESVTIPLLDTSGSPLFSVDYGKPSANIQDRGGSLNPRVNDYWSGNINYFLVGKFQGSNAHSKANTLVKIIKSDPGNEDMELTHPFTELPNPITVAPSAGDESALTVSYPPGYKNYAEISLGLTEYFVSNGSADRDMNIPTATGTGPIELKAGGSTIEMSKDIQIQRSIGRPNDVFRKRPNAETPTYYPKHKVTFDEFGIQFFFTENTLTKLQTIGEEVFRQQLARGGIKLDFNGLFNLGEFDVFPTGSAPFRQQRLAGYDETVQNVPTLDLRVIRT